MIFKLLYHNFVTYYFYKYYFYLTYLKQILPMKKILLLLVLFTPVFLFAQNLNFNNHIPSTVFPYNPAGYSFAPSMLQGNGSAAGAPNSNIIAGKATDCFVNFNFDTSGKSVYMVYTTDGTNPTKTNGIVVNASFSTYTAPNDRLWKAVMPALVISTNVKYVFYASDGSLSAGWGRIAGSGLETSWTEGNIFFSNTVLPITLSSFDVRKNNEKQNQLSWTTESEKNASLFEIEKSVDGKSWIIIGTVNAVGITARRENYSFIDKNPTAKNYYRLKMIDRDGSSEYSKVVSVSNRISTILNLYPNPVKEQLSFNIEGGNINEANIQVINICGQVVLVSKNTIGRNATPISLDTNELQAGVYFIRITDENSNMVAQEKFLKQ